MDGGRFIGTAVYLVTQDKETEWINCGTYRMQIHDRNHCGVQIIKGKHADFHFNQHKKDGTKMPAAAVIGADAVHFLVSSTLVSAQTDEYDIISTLRQDPCEIFVSDLTGLKLPANAEIILEGWIDPNDMREEGPFGEYTGYYSGAKGEEWPKQVLHIERILRRNKPIFWGTTVGKTHYRHAHDSVFEPFGHPLDRPGANEGTGNQICLLLAGVHRPLLVCGFR